MRDPTDEEIWLQEHFEAGLVELRDMIKDDPDIPIASREELVDFISALLRY